MPPAPRARGFQAEREVRGNADRATSINESFAVLDEQVLDPEGPLAVQIPAGVGADGTEAMAALRSVYETGTVESQFAAGTANKVTVDDPDSVEDNRDAVRSVGESQDRAEGDPMEVHEYYETHSVPAVRREAAGEDVQPDEDAAEAQATSGTTPAAGDKSVADDAKAVAEDKKDEKKSSAKKDDK